MKKKTIISIIAVVILIAAVVSIIIFSNKVKSGRVQTYNSMEDAKKDATFDMEYPDRLGGIPYTSFKSNSSTVEVHYGNENYIRKTLGVKDNSDINKEYKETSSQDINGMTVTFKGNDGLIYIAVWNDNNFGYTVNISSGVTAEQMTEYIEATR